MKIKSLITEKTLELAKMGKYTFLASRELTKPQIKERVNKLHGVHVRTIKSANYKPEEKRNMYRKKVNVKGFKKAIVTLNEKEKIEGFSEEKK